MKLRQCNLIATFFLSSSALWAFSSEEVTVFNAVDSLSLNGTLTIPVGNVKAAVVMATGSGVQNRDEEILGHRPFKAIAESLAEHGYAALRMDDRGYGDNQDNVAANSTNENFCRDIAAGASLLSRRFPGVPVGIIGHSEGGTTAIKLAARQNVGDFIITLAAPAWSGDSIIMSQARALASALTGRWEGEKTQRMCLDLAKGVLPVEQKRVIMLGMLVTELGDVAKLPTVQESLLAQVNAMLSPWYVDMLRYNPAADIADVKVPWLALNGNRDLQVLPQNLDTIKELNNNADTLLLPGLNHLFLECSSGLPQEYQQLQGDIATAAIESVVAWLDSRFDR